MYAVVKTGGKQYRMAPGQVVQVEKLPGAAGDSIQFPEVLAVVGDDEVRIGDPLLPQAKVSGEIVAQKRARKILVFKSKRRKGSKKMRGHRQSLTEVKI
ncbi:MAG: 50S ribosomal protein L21, partial [Deltaproteobacteria bacterium]|nr:50S ribosomal protein L21 [Candidatus Anaeroferrophillacea bacterium]